MSVRTLVTSIQDIMRQDTGVDGDAQRISQLCWMCDRLEASVAAGDGARRRLPDSLLAEALATADREAA